MAEFLARVGLPTGEVREESYVAESEEALRRDLERRDVHVFLVRERAAGGPMGLPGFRRRRVPRQQFLIFNQELVTLIRAGLPLVNCLEILLERMPPSPFREALADVRTRVRSGASLSEAFSAQGDLFPRIYSSSLTAGERSGELDTVIERFVRFEKKAGAIRRRVISAMVYPTILMTVSVAVVGILMFHVLPKFVILYADFGKELPQFTQSVMGVSDFFRMNALWVTGTVVAGAVGFRFWAATASGRLTLDRLRLRVPLFGSLWQKYVITSTARTLSTLLAGGIPLVSSLQITAQSQSNRVVSARLSKAASDVREGNALWDSLERTGFMTNLAIEMIKVGEATGSLEAMLSNIADFYDEEIDQRLSTLLTILEPAILMCMGLVIAVLLLAMYLPIFSTVQL